MVPARIAAVSPLEPASVPAPIVRALLSPRSSARLVEFLVPTLQQCRMLAAVEMCEQRRSECDRPSRGAELLPDCESRSGPSRISSHAEQASYFRQQALALLRKQVVEPQAGTLRVWRIACNESYARH